MNILVYTNLYLSPSMTFIANQIDELNTHETLNVYGGCIVRVNEQLFPGDVYLLPHRKSYLEAAANRINGYYIAEDKVFSTALQRIMGQNNIQLIHAHFGPSGLRICNALKDTRIPILITFHGKDASQYLRKWGYVKELKRVFSRKNVFGTTVSCNMQEDLASQGIPKEKIFPHYLGINTDFFKSNELDMKNEKAKITFLQVSNFVEKKGHKYTVGAFGLFLNARQDNDRFKLIFIGDGPERASVEKQVVNAKITKNVVFLGHQDRDVVQAYMNDADVFLHHSITTPKGDKEGIPTVLMESMAMGLLPVSTYHSGIPELIENGVSGYLVKEKDIVSYSKVLDMIVDSDSLILRNRAKENIKRNFNLRVQTNKLVAIYKDIVSKTADA